MKLKSPDLYINEDYSSNTVARCTVCVLTVWWGSDTALCSKGTQRSECARLVHTETPYTPCVWVCVCACMLVCYWFNPVHSGRAVGFDSAVLTLSPRDKDPPVLVCFTWTLISHTDSFVPTLSRPAVTCPPSPLAPVLTRTSRPIFPSSYHISTSFSLQSHPFHLSPVTASWKSPQYNQSWSLQSAPAQSACESVEQQRPWP